jgi:hypothetical protein
LRILSDSRLDFINVLSLLLLFSGVQFPCPPLTFDSLQNGKGDGITDTTGGIRYGMDQRPKNSEHRLLDVGASWFHNTRLTKARKGSAKVCPDPIDAKKSSCFISG